MGFGVTGHTVLRSSLDEEATSPGAILNKELAGRHYRDRASLEPQSTQQKHIFDVTLPEKQVCGKREELRGSSEQRVTCGKFSAPSHCVSLALSGQQADSGVGVPSCPFKVLGCTSRLILYLELQNVKSDFQPWQRGTD